MRWSRNTSYSENVGEPKTYSANKVDFGKNEGFRRQEVRKW